jgi:hypothetical protein
MKTDESIISDESIYIIYRHCHGLNLISYLNICIIIVNNYV